MGPPWVSEVPLGSLDMFPIFQIVPEGFEVTSRESRENRPF